MHELYILDLIGTATFAYYGAYVGLRRQFDIFGIFVVAFLTAVGGGTLREILLNNTPFYFFDTWYIVMIALGILVAYLTFQSSVRVHIWALLIDAVGLTTFAYIGAHAAHMAELGFVGIVFFAVISAIGGGVIRDALISEVPQVFFQDFYAFSAIFPGCVYFFVRSFIDDYVQLPYLIIGGAILLRYLAVLYRWRLWVPWQAKPQQHLTVDTVSETIVHD